MPDEQKECYRRCFQTADGKKVLGHMLIDMGYFDEGQSDPALREFAAKLLKTLGFTDHPQKVEQLVGLMFQISQKEDSNA